MNDAEFLNKIADDYSEGYAEDGVDSLIAIRLRQISESMQTNPTPPPYDKSEESLDALLREFHGHIQDKFSINVDEISYRTIKTHGGAYIAECNVSGEAL